MVDLNGTVYTSCVGEVVSTDQCNSKTNWENNTIGFRLVCSDLVKYLKVANCGACAVL